MAHRPWETIAPEDQEHPEDFGPTPEDFDEMNDEYQMHEEDLAIPARISALEVMLSGIRTGGLSSVETARTMDACVREYVQEHTAPLNERTMILDESIDALDPDGEVAASMTSDVVEAIDDLHAVMDEVHEAWSADDVTFSRDTWRAIRDAEQMAPGTAFEGQPMDRFIEAAAPTRYVDEPKAGTGIDYGAALDPSYVREQRAYEQAAVAEPVEVHVERHRERATSTRIAKPVTKAPVVETVRSIKQADEGMEL